MQTVSAQAVAVAFLLLPGSALHRTDAFDQNAAAVTGRVNARGQNCPQGEPVRTTLIFMADICTSTFPVLRLLYACISLLYSIRQFDMSFSFNFSTGFEGGDNGATADTVATKNVSTPLPADGISFEVPPPINTSMSPEHVFVNQEIEGVLFSRIVPKVEGESDLIPGKYEGGLKLWECSVDLVAYYLRHPEFHNAGSVLELGCGFGLPGVAALLKGCQPVIFTDFNDNVN